MSATLEVVLPDGLKGVLSTRMPSEERLSRWAVEAMVIEAYREGIISRGKLGEILGLPFHEREAFLAARGIPYNYDAADLEADIQTLDRLLGP